MSALYTNQFLYYYEERYVLGTKENVSGLSNDLRSTLNTSDQKSQNVLKRFEENNS